MRCALDMCCALDMRCGARRDPYHIELRSSISNLRQQIYRMGVAYISTKKGSIIVAENKNQLRDETIDFAIAVSDVCDSIQGCSIYVNQLLRCSSSIGANVHEAKYAQSRADFISKLEIALKESSETDYWLELLYRKQKLSAECYTTLKNQCGTIRRKLIASVTTAKANRGGTYGK